MWRRLLIVIAWCGLLAIGIPWVCAVISREHTVIGCCLRDGWLVVAMIDHRGMVIVRHFEQNPTDRSGMYAKLSDARSQYAWHWRFMVPREFQSRHSTEWVMHAALPQLLAAAMVFRLTFFPMLVRRKRRRRGQCIDCGYDLRAIESKQCPECGLEH